MSVKFIECPTCGYTWVGNNKEEAFQVCLACEKNRQLRRDTMRIILKNQWGVVSSNELPRN